MKRPAAVLGKSLAVDDAALKKRPASEVLENLPARAEVVAGEEQKDGDLVKKALMKKPAAPKAKCFEQDKVGVEDDSGAVKGDEEDAEEAPKKETEEGDEQVDKTAGSKASGGKNEAAEARAAAREVQRKQHAIDKLLQERDALTKKMKTNRDALKCAEEEIENLKAVAKRKAQAIGRIKAAKRKKILEEKAEREKKIRAHKLAKQKKLREQKLGRAQKLQAWAGAAFKSRRKQVEAMREGLTVLQKKAEDANVIYKRAQKHFDEAMKHCKDLRAKGEEVPDVLERDLSAPGAYKPPGIMAAKTREAAKIALAKAKDAWEKVAAVATAKEERFKALKDKMAEVKNKKQAAEGTLGELESRKSSRQ